MRILLASFLLCGLLLVPRPAAAYGVLAHEAIVDGAWEDAIAPLLRARFHASADELRTARAYAYGGSLIQDLGYYPFSSRTFGDLTHYVRSGDFVAALLDEAADINEMAFALGALAHYAADNNGHPLGVNPAVAVLYPKLRAEHGSSVTYQDKPSAHIRTEFAFDVVQIARGKYLPDSYREFIGFDIAKPVLERAFLATYGLTLDEVFGDFDLAVGTFRYAVSTMIPRMTRIAWKDKEDQIFRFSRADYEKTYGTRYKRPGFGSAMVAFLLRIVPKVGPFSALAFKVPTPEAQKLFERSFAVTADRYETLIDAVARHRGSIRNLNFDTGLPVQAGDYELADRTYLTLLERLKDKGFQTAPAGVRAALSAFFARAERSSFLAADPKRLHQVSIDMAQLKAAAASPALQETARRSRTPRSR